MMLADETLLEGLVRIPSVTGSEREAVRFLQAQARADGLRVLEDAAGNFIAETGSGPRLLLFVGHIDTVPGHIPVRVKQGTLWGRGSVDAKGPLAAAYCLARRHKGASDITLRIVGAVDEEGDSHGAKALDPKLRPDWIIVGEPSGVHGVTLAYKGILRGSFALERPRGHGAHPGPTAVEEAIGFWDEVRRTHRLEDHFESLQGHLLSMTTSGDGLVDRVTATFHVRLPPGTDPDRLEADLVSLGRLRDVAVACTERMRPAESSKRTPLAAAFLQAIREQGGEPRLLRKTGTADFNLLAERHPGVPLVAYGPGDAALDHTPDERIDLAEFRQAIDILDSVVTRLASLPLAVTS
ncbi:MAG: [LysW]-lysine hydrolase [Candidatus Thermoplasmatota archaeon]